MTPPAKTLGRAPLPPAPGVRGIKVPATMVAAGNQEMMRALGVHAKLNVSRPSDPEEQEADRLADAFAADAHVARKCACGAEDDTRVRTKPLSSGSRVGTSAPLPGLQESAAQPLVHALQHEYERFFDADLSAVRIHAGTPAAQASRLIHAAAFTLGNDIYFGDGQYRPENKSGRRLLAHELTHVVQQGGGSRAVRPARPRLARQGPITNPVLSPEEMFNIITRERAFTYSPGAGAICEDPSGVGRGVGAAAGGRRAGSSVFAVIQVTDADGRPVALSYGAHLAYGDPHAEARAVTGLRREIPAMRDVSGGRMTVVVDQVPCPPGRANCMGLLQRFANERGLRLEVHLPTREAVGGGRAVAPRTAAMSSMRTDVPPVSLGRYYPSGTTPPSGAGSGGAAGPGVTPTPAGPAAPAAGPLRITPPRPASPAMARTQASLMLSLENETRRSVRLSARIRLVARGVTGLLSVLGMIATLRTFQQMHAHGTIFPDAEEQADAVVDRANEMEQWAMDATDQISLVSAVAAVADGEEREDASALFDVDDALTGTYTQLLERADQFAGYARELRAREQALDVLAGYFRDLVSVPMGPSTAPNAEAFAMSESLSRLSGRVGNAAGHFEAAERQLRFYGDFLEKLASRANNSAWSFTWRRIAFAMQQIDRELELAESLRRERRMNEIQSEIDEIDRELALPVCRLQEELDYYQQRRALLVLDRESLRSAPVGGSSTL